MDRVAAARQRLDQVVSFARTAREAGPPCSDCRYNTLLGNCGNPAYSEPTFEAHSGVFDEAYFTPIAKARADDGLCGPEALLFESRTLPVTLGASILRGSWFGLRAVVFGVVCLLVFAWLLR